MDEDMYDEFGNYIGPDLNLNKDSSSEEDSSPKSNSNQSQ